ncbi:MULTISPECIES: hypothetical protein [Kocuria]|uniref:hypothetical protein n=1 Tax=Kocuria TaxID=57493 RepID=UPI001E447D65|nr:hypothetical protein [Kocuria rosea]
MSAQKRRGGRLAVLAGAALVVPLAVGATVVAAEPDGPGGLPATVAADRSPSPAPGAGPADAPGRGTGQGAGAADEEAAAPEADARADADAGDRTPTSPGPGAARESAGSLAAVAAREPSSPRAEEPPAHGLERAAGQKPENGEGARGRSGEALDRTKGLTQRADVAPDKVHDADTAPGGCLAEYGEAGQCLPTVPPSLAKHVRDMEKAGQDVSSMPHHWDCEEVRTFFPDGIVVRQAGVDPQGLDVDEDGTACSAGD